MPLEIIILKKKKVTFILSLIEVRPPLDEEGRESVAGVDAGEGAGEAAGEGEGEGAGEGDGEGEGEGAIEIEGGTARDAAGESDGDPVGGMVVVGNDFRLATDGLAPGVCGGV